MYGRVMDDATRRRGARSFSATVGDRATFGKLFLLACCLLAVNRTAYAQESVLEATVREVEGVREWIHVAVNKSVLIETNLPATRQQTLSPEIADIRSISPTQVLVQGKSFGRTQVIIWSGEQRKVFDVSVELELDLLREAIRGVSPFSRVDALPVMDTVVLSGTVPDADDADRIMQIASIFATSVQNHMEIAGEQQVLLRVTMAEVSRSVLRQLGINGLLAGENFRDFIVANNIGAINPTTFGFGTGAVTGNLPFITPGTAVGTSPTLSLGFPRVQMQVFLQAIRENGLLKVLAEPNLVAISGRTASFLAGGEFPIPVPQTGAAGTGNTITIEFREFGVRLSFTPVVLANQMIRLNIAPEVSELDFARGVSIGGFVVPGLNVRRTETTIEMGNGQSLVISGLLSENIRATSSRIPGVGDIPVLGALFASTEYRKNLTELMVLVTPEIVSPLNPDQIGQMPGYDLQEPDDWQLFALGLLEQKPDAAAGEAAGAGAAVNASTPQANPEEVTLLGPWGQSDYDEQNN